MRILDFSHRLPGPLAGKILSDLGAEVIKIEDQELKDPFLDGFFAQFDPSFSHWYEELNKKKQILRLDFNAPEIKKIIQEECQKCDGILLSLSNKMKEKLGLTFDELKLHNISVVELGGSQRLNQPMHDLNALMHSGFLKLYIKDFNQDIVPPPFLPFAGISFGQHIASLMLMNIHKAHKEQTLIWEKCYLLETIERVWEPFWNKKDQEQNRSKFLHNGAYPCYSLYRLKDGAYLGLAAVEEKFWMNFVEAFEIALSKEERFSTDQKSFEAISKKLKCLTSQDAQKLLKHGEMCASILN
jgi:alpha-methylacyl-CoA racemase